MFQVKTGYALRLAADSDNANLKKSLAPFYGWGSTVSRLQSHFKETVYLLLLSSQDFLILI